MRLYFALAVLVFFATGLAAQTTNPTPAPDAAPPAATVSGSSVSPDLEKLQGAASQTSTILQRMRIEKWKADNSSKQQSQNNADSIQRNITSALPGMIDAVRSAPQDLNAQFRLYRNVNVLYDVMSSLTESAGAFGSRNEFDSLAQQLEVLDSVRHDLGDSVERLALSTQNEMSQLRTQLRAAQQRAAAAATPPKTTIVDDNEPVKKPTTSHKKKAAPKAPSTPSASSTTQPNQ
jgi:hypothetical protein